MPAMQWRHCLLLALLADLRGAGAGPESLECDGEACPEQSEDETSLMMLRPASGVPQYPVTPVAGQVGKCLQKSLSRWTKFEFPEANETNPQLWTLHNSRVASQQQPTVVVYPRTVSDVQAAVKCAVESGLPVSGQCGRHSYVAYCTNRCMLINVYLMKAYSINIPSQTANLGAGLNLGQAYTYLDKKGFTIPGGTCPTVGLAGLTLGGGKGPLTRLWGLLIDKLIGVRAVLSNGTYVEANEENYPDLLWLAKGGGGNTFPGIATSFDFKLVRRPRVVTEWTAKWRLLCPASENRTVIGSGRIGLCDQDSPGVRAFRIWQDKYLVHPDRRVYVRLELHPYVENGVPPHTKLVFKFLNMTKAESKNLVLPAVRELGRPINSDAAGGVTGGEWTNYSYIESVQRGGGIGSVGGKDCKTWDQNLTAEEAEEMMVRVEPPFCSWDSGFDTNMLYRALVMEKLSETAMLQLISLVSYAPAFDKAGQFWNFYLQIDPSNGAAAEVAPDATPYPWRGFYDMTMQVIAKWDNGPINPTLEAFNYLIISAMQPFQGTRSYYNYADDNMPGGAVPLFSYFGNNAARVLEIRSKYVDKRFASDDWVLQPYRANQSHAVQPWQKNTVPYSNDLGTNAAVTKVFEANARD